jgi:site-specific DNA-cytosine methylase
LNENIKWCSIQPLTGGFYCSAESAVGHPAEFILSYPGLDTVTRDRDGNIKEALNECNITTYLKNHDRMPPYYLFDGMKIFDNKEDLSTVKIVDRYTNEQVTPNYSDIDLAIAVPICSGLSTSTITNSEGRIKRNQNMLFLARYALNAIKPKVYIFENAPTLMGNSGKWVREALQKIANDAGYRVAYYRTDTKLHHNCQRRPRTFVYFFKGEKVPSLEFEHAPVTVEEFLSKIPADATQKVNLKDTLWQDVPIKYLKHLHGDNWRDKVGDGDIFSNVTKTEDSINKFLEWLNSSDFDNRTVMKFTNYMKHIIAKRKDNKGFWICTPTLYRDHIPACMHKNIMNTLHYKEDRLYTCREWLSLMGMPYDFELQGDYEHNCKKIGQNVPVFTGEFIVKQAVKFLNNELELLDCNSYVYFDNIKQEIADVL